MANGWEVSNSITLLDAYARLISEKEKKRVNTLEIFDELEEWNLLMSHYCLTIAIKGHLGESVSGILHTTTSTGPGPVDTGSSSLPRFSNEVDSESRGDR